MKVATLCFLIKKNKSAISEICLGKKKRGFGVNKWNGTGGKVKDHESIEEAVMREAKEEFSVILNKIYKVAELTFTFPYVTDQENWDQIVHAFFCEDWNGEPSESEEMLPRWFKISDIPYKKMWDDDLIWLPKVIEGKLLKAEFSFKEGEVMNKYKIDYVRSFNLRSNS